VRQTSASPSTDPDLTCGAECGKIAFTAEELDGIPADVLSGYTKREDGKLELSFKTPDVMPLVSMRLWYSDNVLTPCLVQVRKELGDS